MKFNGLRISYFFLGCDGTRHIRNLLKFYSPLPTTAGTGSEVAPVAVISDSSRTLKVDISGPYLIPAAAICDPDLTISCPKSLTAIDGADALTHAIEAYTAIRRDGEAELAQQHVFVGKNALSDHFALLAIRLLHRSLERAHLDSSNEAARADVMMGAMAAGFAFGTAGTAAAYAVQYPIGALAGTPHRTNLLKSPIRSAIERA
jgi:alcohol dehydrogenase